MEQLLALGTVVKADLGEKSTALLMIAGYYPRDERNGRVYDYLTVMYPVGMTLQAAVQMIDSSEILSVEADGYLDETTQAFTRGLPEPLQITRDAVLEEIRNGQEQWKDSREEADGTVKDNAGSTGTAGAGEGNVSRVVDPNQDFG